MWEYDAGVAEKGIYDLHVIDGTGGSGDGLLDKGEGGAGGRDQHNVGGEGIGEPVGAGHGGRGGGDKE